MIIELLGLSGSGKTTFSRTQEVNDNFLVLGYQKFNFAKKINIFFKYPVIFFWFYEIISETFKTKLFTLIKFKFALILNTFCIFNKAKKAAKDSKKDIIIDEGFSQRLLSVYDTKKSVEEFKKIFKKNIFLSDVVWVIESDFKKFKRFENLRNNRSLLGEKYLKKWFSITTYNYNNLLGSLEELNISYKIIKINDKIKK